MGHCSTYLFFPLHCCYQHNNLFVYVFGLSYKSYKFYSVVKYYTNDM